MTSATTSPSTVSGPVGRGDIRTLENARIIYNQDGKRFLCEICEKDWPTFQSLWGHYQWHKHPHRGGRPRKSTSATSIQEYVLTITNAVDSIAELAMRGQPDAALWKARALKAERQLATLRKLLGTHAD